MRRTSIAGLAMLLLVAAAPFPYLATAVNDIVRIDHSPERFSAKGAATIAHIACEGFTRLLQDPQLRPTLDAALRRMGRNPQAAQAMLQNLEEFKNEFLAVEAKQLQQVGLSPLAIRDTLDELNRTATSVRQRGPSAFRALAVQDIISNLTYLKDAACNLENRAMSELTEAQRQRLVEHIGLGVLGAAVVVANATILEIPAVPELSEILGGAMVDEALTAFR
jgi:hypothetical protein